jgi:hypothetical protein
MGTLAEQLANMPVTKPSSSGNLLRAARLGKCLDHYEQGIPLPDGDVCQGCDLKDGSVDCEWSLETNVVSGKKGDKFMLVLDGDSKPIFGGKGSLEWLNANKFNGKGTVVQLTGSKDSYKNLIGRKGDLVAEQGLRDMARLNAEKKAAETKRIADGKAHKKQLAEEAAKALAAKRDTEEAARKLELEEARRNLEKADAQRRAQEEAEEQRRKAEEAAKAAKKQSPGKGKSPLHRPSTSSLLPTPPSASESSTSSARVQAAELTDFFAKCIAAKMNQ